MDFKNLFKKKTADISAGLMIYKNIFRYIALERSGDIFAVNAALADNFDNRTANGLHEVFQKLEEFAPKEKLAVSLPIDETMVKILYMPMDVDNVRLALRYELEKYFPVNANEAMFDIAEVDYPFADQYEGKHYLVAVTKRSYVDNLINTARNYGFTIECIEPAQVALERAISLYTSQNTTLFIYAGTRYIQYILFWKGNGIYYRASDFNLYEYPENADAATLQDYKFNNFVQEINAFIQDSYTETKVSPKSIAVFGPSANSGICLKLEQCFASMNVDFVDIMELNGVEMESRDDAAKGYWDIPIGLALRRFDGC